MLMTAAANTVLQTIVDDDKRGRVVSLYTMMVTGLAPVGGLVAGLLADRVGAAATLRLAGLVCGAGAATFAVVFAGRLQHALGGARLPRPPKGSRTLGGLVVLRTLRIHGKLGATRQVRKAGAAP